MGWVERAFDKSKERGLLRVSVKVPLGVNPFRDLWEKFFGNKKAGGEKYGKRRRILEGRNRIFKSKEGGE